jgi:hypothetical protein
MVAPFAGGPHDGQGSWTDGQSRYEASAPHAQTTGPDVRIPTTTNSRQMYNASPPPDIVSRNYPYQDSSEQDRSRQNPQALDRHMGDRELPSMPILQPSGEKQKTSSANGARKPSGSRICGKCGEPLAGQFVRALDNTFHLDCFTCHVSLNSPPYPDWLD